jgi:outer membrane protein TolC
MYKSLSLCSLMFFLTITGLKAQQTDFNRVVLPIEMKAKDFREYLVQLAWLNNPDNDVYALEVENAKDQLSVTKKDWMKDFQVSGNLNEANNPFRSSNSGDPVQTNTVEVVNGGPSTTRNVTTTTIGTSADNVFFPRYNLGVNLNLGNLLSQKGKNHIREREIKMAEGKLNQRKLAIRAETLVRFETLLAANEIYKTRVQIEQDAKSNYILVGSLYKTDEKTFEDYNEASSIYQSAIEARIKADSERRIALYRLEEIIGITWEQVKHQSKEPNM